MVQILCQLEYTVYFDRGKSSTMSIKTSTVNVYQSVFDKRTMQINFYSIIVHNKLIDTRTFYRLPTLNTMQQLRFVNMILHDVSMSEYYTIRYYGTTRAYMNQSSEHVFNLENCHFVLGY